MPVTRTVGPLHLEDLEPHRFEDLIRQLLYDFRTWTQLEAIGRTGADQGFDIRGVERVRIEELEGDDGDEDSPESASTEERVWLVQCKREKQIGPQKLENYLDQIGEKFRGELFGVIFAAACDFSKQARDVFFTACRRLGTTEAVLWGKGEIEDQLFQPKNDHLLFGYFGISLSVRRRSIRAELRRRLATKKKSRKFLRMRPEILLRDPTDERYPRLDQSKTLARIERGRWRVFSLDECRHDGLLVRIRRCPAYIDDDGVHWDFSETCNDAHPMPEHDPWTNDTWETWSEKRRIVREIWDELPERNQAYFEEWGLIRYEDIAAIDEDGDEIYEGPHVFTNPWVDDRGPFAAFLGSLATMGDKPRSADPREANRIEKFPRRRPD